MSNFNPTHEFLGLELERESFDTHWYRDSGGYRYFIPSNKVTKIQPTPKPGEVWKYVGKYAESSSCNLVLITEDAKATFANVEGDTLPFVGDDLTKPRYTKVLNADGSPA